jgi:hypothetical protein
MEVRLYLAGAMPARLTVRARGFRPPAKAASIPLMNMNNPFLFPSIVMGSSMLVSLAWHVVVIVLVYKIWQKVKHLPG